MKPPLFFLSQMLSELAIHECIFQLLRSGRDFRALEGFARLITMNGKDLDHPQAKVGGEEGCRGRMSEKTKKRKKGGN